MKSPILDLKNRMEERYSQLQNDKKWSKSKSDRYILKNNLGFLIPNIKAGERKRKVDCSLKTMRKKL